MTCGRVDETGPEAVMEVRALHCESVPLDVDERSSVGRALLWVEERCVGLWVVVVGQGLGRVVDRWRPCELLAV